MNVLFLCTGNSARSILAEAMLNRFAQEAANQSAGGFSLVTNFMRGTGQFTAFSAGSTPRGAVNPAILEFLQKQGYDTAGLRSKSWDEFADAPEFGLVITLCSSAAGEACPVWPGNPLKFHWGIPDPVGPQVPGDRLEAEIALAHNRLERRIKSLADLPINKLWRFELRTAVDMITRMAASRDRLGPN